LGLDDVGEHRTAILIRERERHSAFGESGDPALTGNPVAIGRIYIREAHLPYTQFGKLPLTMVKGVISITWIFKLL
jgi:hypothetical protein